jgi:hypothetical protein
MSKRCEAVTENKLQCAASGTHIIHGSPNAPETWLCCHHYERYTAAQLSAAEDRQAQRDWDSQQASPDYRKPLSRA